MKRTDKKTGLKRTALTLMLRLPLNVATGSKVGTSLSVAREKPRDRASAVLVGQRHTSVLHTEIVPSTKETVPL